MEYYVLNDIELSFKDVLKRSLGGEPLVEQEELDQWEQRRRERRENGTHAPATADNGKEGSSDGKSDISEGDEEKKENGGSEKPEPEQQKPKPETKQNLEKLKLEKARAVEKSSIQAPQLNLQQIEAAIAKGGGVGYDQEMINDLMAQTYAASVRWPKDRVLLVRLQHIVSAVEADKWPVPENFTLLEAAVAENGTDTPEPSTNNRDTSTPLSEVSTLRAKMFKIKRPFYKYFF